jgi:hypothetical protein
MEGDNAKWRPVVCEGPRLERLPGTSAGGGVAGLSLNK